MLRPPADYYRQAGFEPEIQRRQMMAQALAPAMDAATQHSGLASVLMGALGGYQQRKLMDAYEGMEREKRREEQERRKMIAEAIASGDVRQAAIATGDSTLLKMAFEQSGPFDSLKDLSSFAGTFDPQSLVQAATTGDMGQLRPKPEDPVRNKKVAEAEAALGRPLTSDEMRILLFGRDPQGQSINITLPGNQELETPVATSEQKSVIDAKQQLSQIRGTLGSYADEYLTFGGQAKQAALAFGEKAGLDIGDENKKFLAGATEFFGRVESFFNAYRKDITGAAAAEKELQALKKATINRDLSPTEFKARADALIADINVRLESSKQNLREGLDVSPDDDLIGKYVE